MKLIIHSQDQLKMIAQNDITYCKSDNCYLTVYLVSNEEHVICKSLTMMVKELNPQLFIKVSQSYLINKDYITVIDKKKKTIELKGEKQIPFTVSVKTLLSLLANK